jgi:hypothetical protein
MIEWINARRKLIVAALGLIALIGHDYFGLSMDSGKAEAALDTAITLLTLVGVERTTNK